MPCPPGGTAAARGREGARRGRADARRRLCRSTRWAQPNSTCQHWPHDWHMKAVCSPSVTAASSPEPQSGHHPGGARADAISRRATSSVITVAWPSTGLPVRAERPASAGRPVQARQLPALGQRPGRMAPSAGLWSRGISVRRYGSHQSRPRKREAADLAGTDGDRAVVLTKARADTRGADRPAVGQLPPARRPVMRPGVVSPSSPSAWPHRCTCGTARRTCPAPRARSSPPRPA